MTEKQIVLITGANTGLGLEAVKALYKSPTAYEIFIGCRTVSKGEDAAAALKKEIPESASSLSVVQIDISSDDSIKRAVDQVTSSHGKLDVLINNAGGNFDNEVQKGRQSIREMWNQSWDTNVAGTQVATTLFVPLLFKASNPRIIFITSGTSTMTETEMFDNAILQRINGSPEQGWPKKPELNPITAYRSSKAGLNMMMREWHRILRNDGVKVFAISPGFLATGLAGLGVDQLKKLGAKDPSEGGNFIKDVVEGQRDHDAGKAIRANMIQPW